MAYIDNTQAKTSEFLITMWSKYFWGKKETNEEVLPHEISSKNKGTKYVRNRLFLL